jgi:CBS domain-containing protein
MMRVQEGLRRSAVAIGVDATVTKAAAVMEATGVGALAVLDDDRLTGVVTDRDLVRRVLARGMPPDARVDSVMSSPVVTIDADDDLHAAFGLFRTHGIRRLAVVSGHRFVGMVSVDDLLIDVAGDLADLARPVTGEVLFPGRDAPVPAAL